ncbi:MAG: RNA polymerase sigma factor [Pseudohongiellaceae bacterium]
MNDDSSLIRRTLALRDNDAFSTLVKMHQGRVRAFLVRLCKQYDVADDLAQETFINAFRKLSSYKGTGSFSGWLYRIAYHCFLQHRRSVSRRLEVTDDYIGQLEVLSDRYDSISTEQMDMEQALAQLNKDETATITLCHSYGFSHQEVSDILEMPLGSVKSNISRGKTKLRKILTRESTQEQKLEKAS